MTTFHLIILGSGLAAIAYTALVAALTWLRCPSKGDLDRMKADNEFLHEANVTLKNIADERDVRHIEDQEAFVR